MSTRQKNIYSAILAMTIFLLPASACFEVSRNNPDDYTNDSLPPSVTSITPAKDSTGIPLNASITVVFNDRIDQATINQSSCIVKDHLGIIIDGTVATNSDTLIFTPLQNLKEYETYTVTLSGVIKDFALNNLGQEYSWSFTTGDFTAPTILSTTPANGSASIALNTPIVINFNDDMDASTINSSSIKIKCNGMFIAATVTYDNSFKRAAITPTIALTDRTLYSLEISRSIQDKSGNQIGADYVFSFTTGDFTQPSVSATSPSNGSTGVPLSTNVQIIFSEDMDANSILPGIITVKDILNNTITGTTSYSNKIATFTPSSSFTESMTYTVTVLKNVMDGAGNPMVSNYSFNFTSDTSPNAIFSTIPTIGNTNTNFVFDASGTTDTEDPAGLLQIRWDFDGDGTWDTGWVTTKNNSHQFNANGIFTPKMEVKDTAGAITLYTGSSIKIVPPQYGDASDGNIVILGGNTVNIRALYEDTDVNGVITKYGINKGLKHKALNAADTYDPQNGRYIKANDFTIQSTAILTADAWADGTNNANGIIWISCTGLLKNEGSIDMKGKGAGIGKGLGCGGNGGNALLGYGLCSCSGWACWFEYNEQKGTGGIQYGNSEISIDTWAALYGSGGGWKGTGGNVTGGCGPGSAGGNGGDGGLGGGAIRFYVYSMDTSTGSINASGTNGSNGIGFIMGSRYGAQGGAGGGGGGNRYSGGCGGRGGRGVIDICGCGQTHAGDGGGGGGGSGGTIYIETISGAALGSNTVLCTGGLGGVSLIGYWNSPESRGTDGEAGSVGRIHIVGPFSGSTNPPNE